MIKTDWGMVIYQADARSIITDGYDSTGFCYMYVVSP